jgi:hypothetical protein
MSALPPELVAELAAALAGTTGAGRVSLAIDCDPSGRPTSWRVVAPGHESHPRLFPAGWRLLAPSCLSAAFLRPESRPRPRAGVLGDPWGTA